MMMLLLASLVFEWRPMDWHCLYPRLYGWWSNFPRWYVPCYQGMQRSTSIYIYYYTPHIGNDKGWGVRFSHYGISPSHPYHIGNNYIADASSTTPRVPYALLQDSADDEPPLRCTINRTLPEDLHLSSVVYIWPRNKIRASLPKQM